MKVEISIIIPVYNVEKYLRECLDSIVNQTFKDIEIICVDDGSTDETDSVVARITQESPFSIKYIKQKNQGLLLQGYYLEIWR